MLTSMGEVQEHLCEMFNIEDLASTRLYFGKELISKKYMQETIFDRSYHQGSVFYLEVMELDKSWPTQNKLMRDMLAKV